MAKKSLKGGKFERETCTLLSLWWSHGEHDDIFWRTGGSGGRATVRGKKGRRTVGQHGDICATHPDGDALIKLLTIELKRGYSRFTVADVLDKGKKAATQGWEKFLEQTLRSFGQASSLSWLLIHRRDQRQSVIFFPDELFEALCSLGCFDRLPLPFATFYFRFDKSQHKIHCMRFYQFLNYVSPEIIRRLAQEMK